MSKLFNHGWVRMDTDFQFLLFPGSQPSTINSQLFLNCFLPPPLLRRTLAHNRSGQGLQ